MKFKKIAALCFAISILSMSGCFQDTDTGKDTGKGVAIERSNSVVEVKTLSNLTGAEFIVNKKIDEKDIIVPNGSLKIVQNEGNTTKISVASTAGDIQAGTDIFSIANCTGNVTVSLEKTPGKKATFKRAGTDSLLGDFDKDGTVAIADFIEFANNYGKTYNAKYDISPSVLGTGAWSAIYSQATPDGVVDINDFITFAQNYSKKAPVVLVNPVSMAIAGDATVVAGQIIVLNATVKYSDNTEKQEAVTWTSSAPSIAEVNASTGSGLPDALAPWYTRVKGIAKGTVKINAALPNNAAIVASKDVTVTDAIVYNGIKVHVKNYTHVYAWQVVGGVTKELVGAWPGKAMTADTKTGWYTYSFDGIDNTNLIFTNSGSGKTADLGRTTKGEYWYDTDWHTSDPDIDTEAPKITPNPPAGNVEATSISVALTATDNQDKAPKIYYAINGMPVVGQNPYTGPIPMTSNGTINAIATDASNNVSSVYAFTYRLGQDATPPVVTATPDSGTYETAQTVKFNVTDNKDSAPKAYYTIDGTTPTESSTPYTAGQTLTVEKTKSIQVLAKDASGNSKVYSFNYYIGKVATDRFDPRQESIYFLLTARWFDGDKANSVGDENCSYTPERGKLASNGFTGTDDVSWRGDFKGLVEKMDYIKSLGFTAIWITPIVQNRSPLSYHGYHAWDFTKEDPRLVSPGYDFKRVIDEAHARGMKVCLDIVLNHSGPFGIKNFAELKYNSPATKPMPDEWAGWQYDESKYKAGLSQTFPNNWEYDGLKSPGTVGGVPISPSTGFGVKDLRPFTTEDKAQYPALADSSKYWYDSTMSYCSTIDGRASYSEPTSLTYDQYKSSKRRMRGHNTGFPTGSGSFDNFPDAHFDSLHNHCPDLNTENPEVQNYLLNAYYRYIDMGVDMFRVDTVMHIHKQTLNEMYWPQMLARAEKAKAARGGSDFFIFGEVANFVSKPTDKATQLREQNYTWDATHNDVSTNNHLLNGNDYRTPDYSAKAPNASSPYHVSVINMIAHNGFCNGEGGGYGAAVENDRLYNDATFMPWYADSHDYGPNKGETRYKGDFKPLWSMLFTFRGIPVVYYGSEIRFAQGKPNDWPTPGSAAGTEMSLEKTGRSYYGPNLEGTIKATNFGEYTATGAVATTLQSDESQHLIRLNKIRLAVPALQMGQYSTEGCSGGWASFKRRYTGTNKITGTKIDSYAVVGVGAGTHNYTGILNGKYIDCVTGETKTVTNGTMSFTVPGDNSNLRVYVLDDLTTKAPGKVITPSKFIY